MSVSPPSSSPSPPSPCLLCGRPSLPPHSPFCSRRCSHRDLHHWLSGDYSVPAHEAMEDSDIESLLSVGMVGEAEDDMI